MANNSATLCEKLTLLPDNAFNEATSKFYDMNEDAWNLALIYVERGYENDSIGIEESG